MKKLIFIFLFIYLSSVPINANTLNNTILVTLATSEFGKNICSLLDSEGYNLLIPGRNKDKLITLQKKLQKEYPKISVQSVIIDFSDSKTIETAAHNVSQPLQGIVLMRPRPIVPLSTTKMPTKEEWTQSFQEAFINPIELLRLFGSKVQDNGSIVIIIGNTSKYYTLKFSNVNTFGTVWTGELKNLMYFFSPQKIRVNAISPGIILTPYHVTKIKQRAQENGINFDEQVKNETSTIPLKPYRKVEDLAYLVSFLLSKKSSHINGKNIALDGGEFTSY